MQRGEERRQNVDQDDDEAEPGARRRLPQLPPGRLEPGAARELRRRLGEADIRGQVASRFEVVVIADATGADW